MNIEFRFPRALFESIKRDLDRPHAIAYERVGFVFCKAAGNGQIIIATDYEPVEDTNYIEDEYVGAKINSTAIRRAMQRCLDTGAGIFHVHAHIGRGAPAFSSVDERSLFEMIPTFQSLASEISHGALLLSEDSCIAAIWSPGKTQPFLTSKVSLVGFPMTVWRYKYAK